MASGAAGADMDTVALVLPTTASAQCGGRGSALLEILSISNAPIGPGLVAPSGEVRVRTRESESQEERRDDQRPIGSHGGLQEVRERDARGRTPPFRPRESARSGCDRVDQNWIS